MRQQGRQLMVRSMCLQEESCIAGHLGERAPRTADEDAAKGAAAEEEAADDAVDVPEDAHDEHSGEY